MNIDTENEAEALLKRLDPVPEGRLLAAVSGGADSIMLLYLLVKLRDRGVAFPEVIHINHGWRGDESDGDESFVRNRCNEYGVMCHVYRAPKDITHNENSAREFRYGCFSECADMTGIRTVVLAHQMDDQAETFFMRLLRGAGPDGLGSMRSATDRNGLTVLRPMLGFSGVGIRRFLKSAGISWREDATNAQPLYFRNRIRQRLIPTAEELSPRCVERIAVAAGLIAEDNDALNELSRDLMKRASGRDWFLKDKLAEAPKAIAVRALRQWLRNYADTSAPDIMPDYDTTVKLYGLASGHGRAGINLPGGLHAVASGRFMFLTGIEPERFPPTPCVSAETVFGAYVLTVSPSGKDMGDGIMEQEVPAGFLDGCVVRTRKTGDYLYPFDSGARQSLKDYLINRKIESPWRDRIPLIARGQEIFWVAGVGTGRLPRLNGFRQTERLVWNGTMPWKL